MFMPFLHSLRLRLEFVALWLAVTIARAMPLDAASWLSGKLWRLIAPRLGRQKRALANLALAFPEKSLGQRRAIAAAMWENLGRTFAESFRIDTLTKGDRIAFEPAGDFDAAANGAKPFIVCGLHLGNWEILAQGGRRLGVSLVGVYQRVSNPYVETLIRRLRAPLYPAGLLPKTPMTARPLLRAIAAGGSPCFLADLRDDRGPRVPFFGRPARSNLFPAQLARRNDIPLYAGAAFRVEGARFRIRIAPVPMPRTNDPEADALAATEALQRQYETFIREAPEQWMWAHRKWDEHGRADVSGNGSDVGKSTLVAGFCRALANRGLSVRPFKPQNMSNNAAVTADGGEIGRAQALQAIAARVEPTTDMNPVLLKPEADRTAQLVVQGRVRGTLGSMNFREARRGMLAEVMQSYRRLEAQCDIVVVEGAGSPAEINLRAGDIANMGFARAAEVPVVLVGDIDRGGVIAAMVGTRAVLDPDDAAMIRGFIINKFRGDPDLFDDGYWRSKRLAGLARLWRPALASPRARDCRARTRGARRHVRVAPARKLVVCPILPRIANFDDLDPLKLEPDVEVSS